MAQVDTTIYGRQPQIDFMAPLRGIAFGQQIAEGRQRNKLTEMALAKEQGLNDAYAQSLGPDGNINQNKLTGMLASGGFGSAIPGVQKSLADQQKAQADAQLSQYKAASEQVGLTGQLLGSVSDENSYRAALSRAQSLGIPTEGAPENFDPAWVQQTRQQSLSAKEQLDNWARQQGLQIQQGNLDLSRDRFSFDQGQAGQTSFTNNMAAAGIAPGTPEYQAAALRAAGGTTVNVGAGEKAWDTESAKLFAKRYDDIGKAAASAQDMLGMYDLAESALSSGVRTGFGGEAELNLRRFAQTLGVGNAEKVAGGELVRAIQNRMALIMRSPDGGMGMPGSVSDRDIVFLKDSQIGIDRSPEGNRKMLAAFRALEGRKVEIARLADEYIAANGRLDAGFNKQVREYANANPLFGERPKGNSATSGGQQAVPDRASLEAEARRRGLIP